MVEEYARTAQFRGARFSASDLNGATFRDSDLGDVTIASCFVDGLRISGFDGAAGPVVVDDVRAMVATLDELWAQTRARAEALPEQLRHERVDGESSFVEALPHLGVDVDEHRRYAVRDLAALEERNAALT